jgi:hypothetical protein
MLKSHGRTIQHRSGKEGFKAAGSFQHRRFKSVVGGVPVALAGMRQLTTSKQVQELMERHTRSGGSNE